MTDFDPNLDDLFEGSADKDRRAARDAMAQSADGRRLLAVHDALNDPPSQVDVPNLVPAVMARIAAAAQRSAADQRTAAASPPDTWGMRLAAWLARFNIAPGPVMAVGALAAVVVLAVAIDQGPMRTGGLSGAAVWSAAHVWTAVVAVMFAALAVAWWLRRR